jgi:hypothetical protein
MSEPVSYKIEIEGHLDAASLDWFEGLTIVNLENGKAVLSGRLTDQAALHGVLDRISSLGLALISVNPIPSEGLERRNR